MSPNRDKEPFSESRNALVSVNGSQVWLDNKFDDEVLEDVRFDAANQKYSEIENEELKKN